MDKKASSKGEDMSLIPCDVALPAFAPVHPGEDEGAKPFPAGSGQGGMAGTTSVAGVAGPSSAPPHLTPSELFSRAERQISAWNFDAGGAELVADQTDPIRILECGYAKGRPVSIWIGSDPPSIRYYNHHGGASGRALLVEPQAIPPQVRQKSKEEWRAIREKAEMEAKLKQEEAAARAERELATAAPFVNPFFPYLSRKGVRAAGALREGKAWRPRGMGDLHGQLDNAILVPLWDINGKIWSYQAIFADGAKAHMPGGRARGVFFKIPGKDDGLIYFCEGLATGLSIREATGRTVVVCCDCGNLAPVVQAFREHGQIRSAGEGEDTGRPAAVIVADNDYATKRKRHGVTEPWNPGLEAAMDASRRFQVPYCVPMPDDEIDADGYAVTDANDYAAKYGLEALAGRLKELHMPPPGPEPESLPEKPAGEPAGTAGFGSGGESESLAEVPAEGHAGTAGSKSDGEKASPDGAISPRGLETSADPIPLRRQEPGQAPYPAEAFGPFRPALEAMARHCCVHPSIAGGATLAYLSLFAQRLRNAVSERYTTPLSLNVMAVMDSGGGKDDVERIAGYVAKTWEEEKEPKYREELKHYNLQVKIREKIKAKLDRDFSQNKIDEEKYRQSLEELEENAPVPPLTPVLTSGNLNVEGLYRELRERRPSHGVFAPDGGVLFGNLAFQQEHRLQTLASFTALWSHGTIDKMRSVEGSSKLRGRRVCMSLMIQPVVAEQILRDQLMDKQGFLPRFLVSWPERLPRHVTNVNVEGLPEMQPLYEACRRMLEKKPPEADRPGEPLQLEPLRLSGESWDAYVRYSDEIEDGISGEDRSYASVLGYAVRSAEQALRIAGVLAVADDPDAETLGLRHMEAGCTIARWYLEEILRIARDGVASEELRHADAVMRFLQKQGIALTSTSQLLVYGPNALRSKHAVDAAVAVLVDHGWLKPAGGGHVWFGDGKPFKAARRTWAVVPGYEPIGR